MSSSDQVGLPLCLSQAFARFITPLPIVPTSHPLHLPKKARPDTSLRLIWADLVVSHHFAGLLYNVDSRILHLDTEQGFITFCGALPVFSSVSEAPVLSPGGPALESSRRVMRHPSKSLLAGSWSASLRPLPSCRSLYPNRFLLLPATPCPSSHCSGAISDGPCAVLSSCASIPSLKGRSCLSTEAVSTCRDAASAGLSLPWSHLHTAEAAG